MSLSNKSGDQGHRVTELLEKCSHYDKDERYMATNDLCNELLKGLAMDEPLENRICTAILKQLDDQSNDVQSVAVKCLGVLFKRIHLVQMEKIADKLCKHILQGNESLRDIYAIGLKTLLADIPEDLGVNVAERMTAQLLNGISDKKSSVEVRRECVDILSELLRRFGRCVQGDHERIMNVILAQLQDPKAVIKKRASICLGSLSVALSDELLDLMVKIILQQISKAEAEKQSGHLLAIRTLIHTIGTVSRAVGRRLRSHLGIMIPLFLRFCGRPSDQEEDNEDFDEMAENCFSGVESFISSCAPRDMTPFLPSILEVAVMFLSYDPNFCYDDDDEEAGGDMDVDGDEYGDYDDMGDGDIGAEDDDHSWKVRKAAARVLSAVIRHGELSSEAELVGPTGDTRSVGDLLIGRFKERVENVRLDVLDCFSALVKRFSVHSKHFDGASDAPAGDMELVEDTSAGSMQVDSNAAHFRFFASHTALIAKKCKQLFAPSGKGSSSADDAKTRVAAIGVIRLLTVAMEGHVNLLIPDLLDALRQCLSDSQQAVKLEAVGCLRQLFVTHVTAHRSELQQRVPGLLPAVQALVNEEWYKLTIEGLKLYGVFVTTLRPAVPGTSHGFTAYDVTCAISDSALAEAVLFIFNSVTRHVSSQDNDQEVRESGLAVVGALLAHFGEILLTDGNRSNEIFNLLLKRVENEVTRMSAMRALINVASSSQAYVFAASSEVVSVSVFSAVTRLLGQQDRSLKQTALRLLNALVCVHAPGSAVGNNAALYDGLLSELIALMTDGDLFICNLAVTVARNVVLRYYPTSGDMSNSIHSLLMGRAVALVPSSLLPEPLVAELRSLLCELGKGGLELGAASPLVTIVSRLISSSIEGASASSPAGSIVPDAPVLARAISGGGVAHSSRALMTNAASCVAGVVLAADVASPTGTPITVSQLCSRMLSMINSGSDVLVDDLVARKTVSRGKHLEEICVQFGLLTLGGIGREMDVSSLTIGTVSGPGVGALLFDAGFALLDHSCEDVKNAASFCVGNLSFGNASSCLQRLISAISSNLVLVAPSGDSVAAHKMRTQHLLLAALKIVIVSSQASGGDDVLINSILHPCLISLIACSDESVRGVVAECLGALMETHSLVVIPELLEVLRRSGPAAAVLVDDANYALAQWTVATALRHGLSKRAPAVANFLCRSRDVTDVFFETLFQSHEGFDLDVRRASLLLLNTLISHNKDVVEPYLVPSSRVFLSLKDSLVFKKVYKVDLGPYKHEVDDGIPLRKATLTCLETILLAMPHRFSAPALMEGLLLRLADKDGMIKLQTYQVLSKAFTIDHNTFALCDLDQLIKPMEKVIFNDTVLGKGDLKPTGDNNVRPLELMRGALRVVHSVGPDSLLLAPNSQKAWAVFVDKIMATAELCSAVEQIRLEVLSN